VSTVGAPDAVGLQDSTASLAWPSHGSLPLKRSTPLPKIMSEVQALSDEAWNEFTATSPEGIDHVAEASLRGLMVARIRHAVAKGVLDRRALRDHALNGL
jgi:hypothetical protein